MVDVSFLGRLLLLPFVQHTRAQKKLYRTRMSVFCMEQKNPAPKCWWGGGRSNHLLSGAFFFYSEIAQRSGSWWFQWLGGCWFVSFSWGDIHTHTVQTQRTNQATPSAHTCNKDVVVYTGKSCCGCCCDIYFSTGNLCVCA
jgi:hypothetical protein